MTLHSRNRNASTRLSLNELEHLDTAAKKSGRTRSEFLRYIIIKHQNEAQTSDDGPQSQHSMETLAKALEELKKAVEKLQPLPAKGQGDLF